MSHEITRMYATARAAAKAAEELAEEGYSDVFVVNPPTANDVPLSAIAAQIAQGRVLLADARIYAKGVAEGNSLVTVHAPFATGKLAEIILDQNGPVPSGMAAPAPAPMWDEAAPLSSILMMDTVIDCPSPMSQVLGVSPLASNDCSASGLIGLPLVTSGETPDGRWGFKFLSNNPAPLSSLLGLPLLKEGRRRGA